MTGAAIFALSLAGVFAVGDWASRLLHNDRLEYVCKPATLVALSVVAIVLHPAHDLGSRRDWFVLALALSLAGDVLLMLPADLFLAGLAAFLLAHASYVVGFLTHGPTAGALVASSLAVIALVSPLAWRVMRSLRDQPPLKGPVALYILTISLMLALALATGNAYAGAGAALFAASDSMIAWDRFVRSFRAAPVAIMVTYHLGQAGLVVSLLG